MVYFSEALKETTAKNCLYSNKIDHAMRKRLQHMLTAKDRSAQSDQGIRYHQILSTDAFNGEQMPDRSFAHVQGDVNPYILRIHEGTF